MQEQLVLNVQLRDEASFESFYAPASTHNALLIAQLKQQLTPAGETFVYVWGASASGRTHLLHAACHNAEKLQMSYQYLPLKELIETDPEQLFASLETLDLVCLDDLEAVVGLDAWEFAIFTLYNRMRDVGKKLLVAADRAPRDLDFNLHDLRSRCQAGFIHRLQALDDNSKVQALQSRAQTRGMTLTVEVAQYLIQHLPRDTGVLFSALNQLDSASLVEQRKLTIPFVKKVLSL